MTQAEKSKKKNIEQKCVKIQNIQMERKKKEKKKKTQKNKNAQNIYIPETAQKPVSTVPANSGTWPITCTSAIKF